MYWRHVAAASAAKMRVAQHQDDGFSAGVHDRSTDWSNRRIWQSEPSKYYADPSRADVANHEEAVPATSGEPSVSVRWLTSRASRIAGEGIWRCPLRIGPPPEAAVGLDNGRLRLAGSTTPLDVGDMGKRCTEPRDSACLTCGRSYYPRRLSQQTRERQRLHTPPIQPQARQGSTARSRAWSDVVRGRAPNDLSFSRSVSARHGSGSRRRISALSSRACAADTKRPTMRGSPNCFWNWLARIVRCCVSPFASSSIGSPRSNGPPCGSASPVRQAHAAQKDRGEGARREGASKRSCSTHW